MTDFSGASQVLCWSCHQDLPPLTSDRDKVWQILLNLVGNAVKFTQRGSITLRVQREGGRMLFSIEDTGTGIPEDKRGRVFEKFEQVPQPRGRPATGTGLGLPIARSLAELLGGTLTLSRVSDHGCTFVVSLPLAWDAAATEEDGERIGQYGCAYHGDRP